VRRHPGLRAGDRLPRDNRVTLAPSPENRRPLPGQDLIAGLTVIDDETGQLHAVLKRPGARRISCSTIAPPWETPEDLSTALGARCPATRAPPQLRRWRPWLRVPIGLPRLGNQGVAARLGVRRAHRRHDQLAGEQLGECE